MDNLIKQLVLTGLAASVSPIPVAACINILSYKNAVKNSLAYLLGFTLTLLALGIAGLFIFQIGSSSSFIPDKVRAYVDIGLGIICFGLIFFILRKRPGQKENNKNKVSGSMKTRTALSLGALFMTVNYSTLVIYVSGLHLISEAKLGITDDILSLGFLTLITLITLLVPIGLYIISPEKAGRILSGAGAWLTRHSKTVGVIILVIFGFYLVMRGFRAL